MNSAVQTMPDSRPILSRSCVTRIGTKRSLGDGRDQTYDLLCEKEKSSRAR
jgi:hypothetical protein